MKCFVLPIVLLWLNKCQNVNVKKKLVPSW